MATLNVAKADQRVIPTSILLLPFLVDIDALRQRREDGEGTAQRERADRDGDVEIVEADPHAGRRGKHGGGHMRGGRATHAAKAFMMGVDDGRFSRSERSP